MTTFLHRKLIMNLTGILRIGKGSSILLAVSCGQDSLCMLKLFLDLRVEYRFRLGIIHIDHQWRNDSTRNTRHLIRLLEHSNIETHIVQIKPTKYTEAEARELRYQLFIAIADKYQYSQIMTAHSATDQVETCIQNIIRGSTLDGLNSLRWNRPLKQQFSLARPLLNFSRSEITWFCRYYALPVWTDQTNFDYVSQRSRIRCELIPYLQDFSSTKLEQQISSFLDKADLDCEYLRQITVKIYQQIKHPYLIAINYARLIRQHLTIQIRILTLFYLRYTNQSLPSHILRQVLMQITNELPLIITYQGIIFELHTEWLYIRL
jgi:tRNA(Ile)-lysidine synthase